MNYEKVYFVNAKKSCTMIIIKKKYSSTWIMKMYILLMQKSLVQW